jgi:hypothetical protein
MLTQTRRSLKAQSQMSFERRLSQIRRRAKPAVVRSGRDSQGLANTVGCLFATRNKQHVMDNDNDYVQQ